MEATLQGIFKTEFEQYKKSHGLSMEHHRAARAIMNCRTEKLGYEEWSCLSDGHVERETHSCRHRSCPRCQKAYEQEWLEKTQTRLIGCDHYHVVFTLPHELNDLWHFNRRWCTDHLIRAAVETLQQLLKDENYLGAEVGILACVHTWGRTLIFHPHVHLLVTGGGLSQGEWKALKKNFLLPVGVIKAKFRGKWLAWLNQGYAEGEISLPEHWGDNHWKRVLSQVAKKNWNIRIQGPYRHGQGVVNYLSRYVRGGPIKDPRIIAADGAHVRFRYMDHHDGKEKTMRLKTEQFMSRVMSHVPEKGQHIVRYYGLYVPNARVKRDLIRKQLGMEEGETVVTRDKKQRNCPDCGGQLLHRMSVRRENSYIRCTGGEIRGNGAVQQGVQVDRVEYFMSRLTNPCFFGPEGGNLT